MATSSQAWADDVEQDERVKDVARDLLRAGKHLKVKLEEVYRATDRNPVMCDALQAWARAVRKAEGR